VGILYFYQPEQYHSRYLFLYCIGGLAKNLHHLTPIARRQNMMKSIMDLTAQYQLDEGERKQILDYLEES
jgi:hypothetical protein